MSLFRSFRCGSLIGFPVFPPCRLSLSQDSQPPPLCRCPPTIFKRQISSSGLMNCRKGSQLHAKMKGNIQAPDPKPREPSFPTWARWVLGSILSATLPFWKKRWENLLKIEGEVEMVAETAATVVETVAEVTEMVSAKIADKLPQNDKTQNAISAVEKVSKEAAKDAQITLDFIHKVDELKEEVEAVIDPLNLMGKDSQEKNL